MNPPSNRKALFVYFSYTGQARRVTDTMTETLRADGYDVTQAPIELTDKRWAYRFAKFPQKKEIQDVLVMVPAQLRKATGEIKIPDVVNTGRYDLVVIGSPTWWLTTNIPIRSFLKSPEADKLLSGTPFAGYVVCRRYWGFNLRTLKRLGIQRGGTWLDGIHFCYAGGQVRSLLAMLTYLSNGEYRDRIFGMKLPKTNLQPGFEIEATKFAHGLSTLQKGSSVN